MSLKGTISAAVALISCPCHLPIVMPFLLTLTAGTALGAWLTTNQPLIWALFTLIFLVSLVGAFLAYNPSNQGPPNVGGEKGPCCPISEEKAHE